MVAQSALKIAETSEGYVLQLAGSSDSSVLLITSTVTVDIVDMEKQTFKSTFRPIAGLIGIIHLYSNYYLLTADTANMVGTIQGDKKVYKVATNSVLPLNAKHTPDQDEFKYVDILKSHLDSSTLYFSYDYDLTKTFGKQLDSKIEDEFMWNHFVSKEIFELADQKECAHKFIFPLIYGYVKFVKTAVNRNPVTFGLVTRRSRFRAGTRYFRRGINVDGYVANFNETEQFLVIHANDGDDEVCTYLQTRGSVPVYWAEMNNLKYKPKLLMGSSDYIPTRKHFDRSITKYGTNYLVNLVNQSGYEKPVKLSYENAVAALNDKNIKYTYFDFHHECRKMRWDRVKLLLQHLTEIGLSQDDYSMFIIGKEFVAEKTQGHVVRTNCMDCLDRTNVVQSMIGRWYLQKQLVDAKVIDGNEEWAILDPGFNLVFQNIWADNADFVSKAYSGTGALKTDYTRTGKRTNSGALNDLFNSITRYIKNNFLDGPRQDGFDLFLGNALPYEITTSPFKDSRPRMYQAVPVWLAVCMLCVCVILYSPKQSLWSAKNFISLLLFFVTGGFSLYYIVKNGIQYVNWPSLCKLDFLTKKEVINDGKSEGFEYAKTEEYNKYDAYDKKQ